MHAASSIAKRLAEPHRRQASEVDGVHFDAARGETRVAGYGDAQPLPSLGGIREQHLRALGYVD
jgi:hypothetical protein